MFLPRKFRVITVLPNKKPGPIRDLGTICYKEQKTARTIAVLGMEVGEVRVLQYFSESRLAWVYLETYYHRRWLGVPRSEDVQGRPLSIYPSSSLVGD